MKDLWLDHRAIEDVTGWPDRTIRHKAKNGELKSRLRSDRGRNGRPVREYSAVSLPAEFQKKLMQKRLADGHTAQPPMALIPHPESHDTQLSMFVTPPAIANETRLALAPEQREQADRRLEIISPLLDFRRRTNGHRPVIRLLDGREIRNMDDLAQYVAAQHDTSRATVWRWYNSFQKFGYAALADDVRSDKGTSRFFTRNPEAAKFAQAKYLTERLSITLTHEALLRDFEGKWFNGEPPCYDTVRSYLASLPKPVTILAREGEAAFHEQCAPYLLTDFNKVGVNQIWVSDHGKHDVWVRNDCFTGLPRDAALRPWLTAILDMRSRKIVGAVWNATPSSHTISSSLRQAISQFGTCETFYIDNGKDYTKIGKIDDLDKYDYCPEIGKIGFSPEASGVLARLGIKPQYCIPKHPQSKLIESWFSTVRKRFDSKFADMYCAGSPAARHEACDEALKRHRLALKEGNPNSSPLMLASEFIAMAKQWIFEDYNERHVHTGRAMNGCTPNEVFNGLLPEDKRHLPEDPHALDALFWDRQKRRVVEGGCVRINGEQYEPADATSFGAIYEQLGEDIWIACDPCDLAQALALDQDGHYLGRVQCQKLLARGPISHDDIRAGMRRQRAARRAVKGYIDYVGYGVPTEIDVMRSRASLPVQLEGETAPRRALAAAACAGGPAFAADLAERLVALDESPSTTFAEDIARKFVDQEEEVTP